MISIFEEAAQSDEQRLEIVSVETKSLVGVEEQVRLFPLPSVQTKVLSFLKKGVSKVKTILWFLSPSIFAVNLSGIVKVVEAPTRSLASYIELRVIVVADIVVVVATVLAVLVLASTEPEV